MIVLRTPKGWTGPKTVDGLPVEGTWRSHQVPLSRGAHESRAPGAARVVAARATAPRSCSTRDGTLVAGARGAPAEERPADERQPARERRPAAPATSRFRTSATTRSRCRAPGTTFGEATRVLGSFLRDVVRLNADELPAVRARRDGVEPARRGLRGDRPRTGTPRSLPTDDHLALDGRVHGGAVRASVPGLARGIPPHRQARPLQLLRGVHPHRRLDVQPAREVAEGDARHPVAPPDRVAELPAHARTSGARTTTDSRIRIPASSTTS